MKSSREQAMNLLSKLSVEQKIAQLQCMMVIGPPERTLSSFEHGVGEISIMSPFGTARDVARNNRAIVDYVMERSGGIPPVIHVEALSGVMAPETTIFPSAIAMAATFDPDTLESAADTIRGQMISAGFRRALSPVMDVCRDPRWGRIGETYGEDPTLCARMSAAFVKGLQGEKHQDGAAATGKHFLGYGNSLGGLNIASNPIPERELREVYAKPFQAAITESSLMSMMNSYGSVNGEMIVSSKKILTDLLRGEMEFNGVVVSDYMSLVKLVNHHIATDFEDAAIRCLKAGLDVECPTPEGYTGKLAEALKNGKLSMEDLDAAVCHVLTVKYELGLFDNPYPREEMLDSAYHAPEHREKSLKMARESIVLMKNDGVLPLKKEGMKLALIGPHADNLRLMFGCYTYPASVEMMISRSMSDMEGMDEYAESQKKNVPADGFVQSDPFPGSTVLQQHSQATGILNRMFKGRVDTLLDSLKKNCGNEIVCVKGCDYAGNDESGLAEAMTAAKAADAVILAVGGKYGWGKHCTIGEGIDADSLSMPGIQEKLAEVILSAGKPTIVVHMDARPLSNAAIHSRASAVLECWFPGMTGGQAIAEVIFGDTNPSGKMPVTVARHTGQIPIYMGHKLGDSYSSYMNIARYCDSTKTPLYYFGHGLSYTSFTYDRLEIQTLEDHAVVSCRVTNTGSLAGDEVVQLYVTDDLADMLRPAMELAGFRRVHLDQGESITVHFVLRYSQFAYLDAQMNWLQEAGTMTVRVGGSSNDLPLKGAFEIPDTMEIKGSKRAFWADSSIE